MAAWMGVAVAGAPALTWDFDKPDAINEFKIVNGDWTVDKGVILTTNKQNAAAQRALVGDEKWTDYTIEAKVRIDQGNWAGIVFRAKSDFEYYIAYLNIPNQKSELWRHLPGGHDQRVAINSNFAFQGGVGLKNGEWISAKIVVEGDKFSYSLNGKAQWDATDANYKNGRIGVWTWQSAASFDDLTITGKGIPVALSVEPIGKLATTWAGLRVR
jgi:hypothetical protein